MNTDSGSNYFLGLDIGTDSVGWAVTDTNYQIVRRKGKSLWGVRLFDAANTAEERRVFRTGRRRNQRRRQRIMLLQDIFSEEMAKVDPYFFQRLNDSAFWMEDKQEPQIYSLFSTEGYTDVNYYKEFPTIYHLRSALLREKKPFDIRLLYLALHHLMKHRGHFLFSGEIGNVTSFHTTFQTFLDCLEDELGIILECDSEDTFEDIIKTRTKSRMAKCAELEKLCHIEKSDSQVKEIIKLVIGMKASLSKIFDDEEMQELEHDKISFSESNYEEVRTALDDELQEKTEIIDVFHAVYNWAILADILADGEFEGNSYLSVAKVNSYNKHQMDLQKLKTLIRRYCPEEYKMCFSVVLPNNYCAYAGQCKKGGRKQKINRCSQEDFYKYIKKILSKMPADALEVAELKSEIDNKTFLELQVSKDNGVIPYQVNKMELEKILSNTENYYPFLKKIDPECGKSASEKIINLFEFRIPYYVGPLNTANGENSWMKRKAGAQGEIRPWNFDEKVDRDASAGEFIERLTNFCTYLPKEKVLPKNSLLYSEFMVLNELNNVKLRNEKLPVGLKQEIVQKLFKEQKQVTGKKLLDFLNANGYDVKKEELSGFEGNLKGSLSSYITLKKILGSDLEKYSVRVMAEDIIRWITVYGEDQKMLRRVICKHYQKQLSEGQLKALCRLKFEGWGRLSERFLKGIRGADCTTGESLTIMEGLWNTQNNLMQLLSQQYTFMETIDEENGSYQVEEITYEHLVKDIVASPSIRRAVWQTVQVAEEIKKIMGSAPKKIFVEMARGKEEQLKDRSSRRSRLQSLYESIKDDARDWKAELEKYSDGDFKAIKLYLYYTQMGRCMYTGKAIDLSQLNDKNIWDRDHIYPQSKTKDDSLDNLVLVDRSVNAKKGNGLVTPDIQKKMSNTWKFLLEKGLISQKKYDRLTRTADLTEEELAGFINRQLVETRQSSKVVATLFKRIYVDTEIVYVKAKAVSDFYNETEGIDYVKVRDLNDYHHAKDAYLNIVVGNVYHTKFTDNPLRWLKENPKAEYSLDKMFSHDLNARNGDIVWKLGKDGSIKTVNDALHRNDILFTRYAYCNKGGFFNQTIAEAPEDRQKAKLLVPIKKGMDPYKYGGYTSVTPSHFMLVESSDKKGKRIRTIETVPLYRKKEFEESPQALLQYCEEFYGLKSPRIILPCIKKNARLIVNGFPMHLKGSTGKQLKLQGAVQLCLDPDAVRYLKKILKYLEENAQRRDKRTLLEVRGITGITKDKNYSLYQTFLKKLDTTIYQYRPANPKDKIEKSLDIFQELLLEEQCIVLGEILHLFQCRPVTANLVLIGGSGYTGAIQIGKQISNYQSVKLVSQSVTGIFEQVTDLLTL